MGAVAMKQEEKTDTRIIEIKKYDIRNNEKDPKKA